MVDEYGDLTDDDFGDPEDDREDDGSITVGEFMLWLIERGFPPHQADEIVSAVIAGRPSRFSHGDDIVWKSSGDRD